MIDISAFELMFHQLSKVDELTDRWLSEIAVAKALKIEVKDLKLYLSKSCHYNDICTDGEKNQTGCFRILKTIGKPRFRHSFFYFEKLQRPDFKLPPPMWYEIYLNTKDFRISTRGKNVDLPAETLFSKTTSTGSSHQRQTGNQQQHQTRRDTFEFKLTRDRNYSPWRYLQPALHFRAPDTGPLLAQIPLWTCWPWHWVRLGLGKAVLSAKNQVSRQKEGFWRFCRSRLARNNSRSLSQIPWSNAQVHDGLPVARPEWCRTWANRTLCKSFQVPQIRNGPRNSLLRQADCWDSSW